MDGIGGEGSHWGVNSALERKEARNWDLDNCFSSTFVHIWEPLASVIEYLSAGLTSRLGCRFEREFRSSMCGHSAHMRSGQRHGNV